jgi:hypothetical protein
VLRTHIRGCGSKWLEPGLPKCVTAWDTGHGFPDSVRSRSGPWIIKLMGKAWPFWPGHICALVVILACMGLSGCAGVSSGAQNSNSKPNPNQNQNPAGAGQLSVSPTTMSFGNVALGSQSTLSGTLTAASSDVDVTSAAWSGQGYSVSGITFPVTVTAGKSVNYTVIFTPQASGASSGSVSFVNDGTASPVIQTLDGSGSQAGAHSVALSWNASTSAVIGYNVYRGIQSGGPYRLLTSSLQPDTTYTDAGVTSGTTYYYVTTAVDSNHVESAHSNQAQAAVP